MVDFIPVQDHPDFTRDPNSGAIVNTNRTAYSNAVRAAQAIKEKDEKIKSMSDNINTLIEDVADLKNLMAEFRNHNGNK